MKKNRVNDGLADDIATAIGAGVDERNDGTVMLHVSPNADQTWNNIAILQFLMY